jgi:hypothetical protein
VLARTCAMAPRALALAAGLNYRGGAWIAIMLI